MIDTLPFPDAFPKISVFPEDEGESDDEEEDEEEDEVEDAESDDELESHSYLVTMSGSRVPLAKPRNKRW